MQIKFYSFRFKKVNYFDCVIYGKCIIKWANNNDFINKIEVLSFIDKGVSIDWLNKCGVKVQNILAKGSLNHLKHQLRKTKENHFDDVKEIIEQGDKHNISSNIFELTYMNFKNF